ncbi:hypothetical protein [Gordonia sp. SID5947]|uniref:hypothetical protein n=1 Tax=Gordonia sp. SID5947 TaxID=2690315 RepID=UPI001F2B3AC7|nr:hypothetical protein [Gordonia sp. SID5947]
MLEHYHVSSALNRASIEACGMDWRRMGLARGIAGSMQPEQEGCFLARGERECHWFVRMNNTGGPVDVWQVKGVDDVELLTSPEGYLFYPATIDPVRLTLVQTDIPPESLQAAVMFKSLSPQEPAVTTPPTHTDRAVTPSPSHCLC